MATLRLNIDNHFQVIDKATTDVCTFLIKEANADIEVWELEGDFFEKAKGVAAGNIVKIKGLSVGRVYSYQIIPKGNGIGYAIITY
jgi:hypothetical protein